MEAVPDLPAIIDIIGDTPEEFARFLREDTAKWSKLVKQAGIKPAE